MVALVLIYFLLFISEATSLDPPLFQWSTIDFAWEKLDDRANAILYGNYVPEHNMPNGLARWRNKLFITIPRWKKGVPSSLNYIDLDEQSIAKPDIDNCSSAVLHPYPNWNVGYVQASKPVIKSNGTVVSTFRIHIDKFDRLWVVDNGVVDMVGSPKYLIQPSLVVYDLNTDTVLDRFILPPEVVKPESAFTSIVVDYPANSNKDAFAYITDMGSDAIVVYDYAKHAAWRVTHPYFSYELEAAKYNVGDLVFYWKDGVSSATVGPKEQDGYSALYFQPTSSTKQFKISTRLLRNRNVSRVELMNGVKVIGDRGKNTQSTACVYDQKTNVLFFTQVNKNGFACWNTNKPFNKYNIALIMSHCTLLEFPNDIKIDEDRNLWILSNRQSKFLYKNINFSEINFRIMTAPINKLIQGTPCEKKQGISFYLNDIF